MIDIKINGRSCSAELGESILKAAERNGFNIPTLCHSKSLPEYGACGLCVVELEGRPKLVRACSTAVSEGMSVITDSPRVLKARRLVMELLMSDHEGDCLAPCQIECPAHTDCQSYVKQIALGNFAQAVEIIKQKLPLPTSIGRVCPHPCETGCRRQNVEEPIAIARLKAFAGDKVLEMQNEIIPEKAQPSGKSVGIVGGGPAGLSAAYRLLTAGHEVTIYDSMPQMGGMLRYGIPEYRLPKSVLDLEISAIEKLGAKLVSNTRLGADISIAQLRERHDALLLAVGAWSSSKIRCEGEELEGVVGGIDFLRQIALGSVPEIGGRVAVIGGGNTAMDACRSAVRLGAEKVYIIYRRTRDEMPAEDVEIEEAMEEGVEFRFLRAPMKINGENGKAVSITVQVMKLGEPDASGRRRPEPVEGEFETIDVDCVIGAIGQKLNSTGLDEIELNKWGSIIADEKTMRCNADGVFAAGDATNNGAGIAIEAIAEANRAATAIDAYLCGVELEPCSDYLSKRKPTEEMFKDKEKQPRVRIEKRAACERSKDFGAVEFGMSESEARREAKRCLECGCHDYNECRLIDYARKYGAREGKFAGAKHNGFTETKLLSIEREQGKCILCGLCVRCCEEEVKAGILGFYGRGFGTVIKSEFIGEDALNKCLSCGRCAEICPTGALRIIK